MNTTIGIHSTHFLTIRKTGQKMLRVNQALHDGIFVLSRSTLHALEAGNYSVSRLQRVILFTKICSL